MKQRAKRLMALFMAGVFALSTCMTSGPYTVMATEAGTAGVTTPSEGTPTTPSQGSTTTPDNTTPSGTPEEGETTNPETPSQETHSYTIDLPEQIEGVEWGKVEVTYGGQTVTMTEDKKIVLNNEITDAAAVGIESENYIFENVTVSEGTTIRVGSVRPKLSENVIIPEKKTTLVVGTSCEYSISDVTDVWKDKITWKVNDPNDTKTITGVTLEKQKDSTKVNVAIEKTYFTNEDNPKTVRLSAKIGDNFIAATRDITVEKKNPNLSIKIEPDSSKENPVGWKTQIQISIKSADADFNGEVTLKDNRTTSGGESRKVTVTGEEATVIDDWEPLSNMISTYEFTVTYDGNDIYKNETKTLTYDIRKENQDEFSIGDPKDVTYGDEKEEIATVSGTECVTGEGHEWKYTFEWDKTDDGQDIADRVEIGIDDKNNVVFAPKNTETGAYVDAGTYGVTVKRSSADYNEKNFHLTINVKKKALTVKNVTATNRVYDGTDKVEVTATVDTSEMVEKDRPAGESLQLTTAGKVQGDGKLEGKDVADGKTVKYGDEYKDEYGQEYGDFSLSQELNGNYELVYADNKKPDVKVNITKQKLTLAVVLAKPNGENNIKETETETETEEKILYLERQYTGYKDLSKENKSKEIQVVATGFVNGESAETLTGYQAPRVIVDTTVITSASELNHVYKDALIPDENKTDDNLYNATDNYEFDFGNITQKGSLSLTPQKIADIKAILSVDNANSKKAYQRTDNKEIYYGEISESENGESENGESENGESENVNPKIAWKIDNQFNRNVTGTSDLNAIYNAVEVRHQIDIDIPEEGASLSYSPKKNDETIYVRLKASEGNGVTQWCEMTLINDTTAPGKPTITIDGKTSLYEFASKITFGLFKNKSFEAKISNVSDEVGGSELKTPWSYVVVNLTEDKQFSNKEGFESQFENMEFKTVDGNKTTVNLGSAEEAGNFVVFVLLEDNVGNKALYGSNGVIVDITKPESLSLNYKDENNIKIYTKNDTDYVRSNKIGDKTITGDDIFKNEEMSEEASEASVELYAVAKEKKQKGVVYSGIKNITASVSETKENGSTFTAPSTLYTAPESISDTLDGLSKYCTVDTSEIKNGTIKKEIKEKESATYTIEANTEDFAGNELAKNVKKTVVLDTKAPEVSDNRIVSTEKEIYKINNQVPCYGEDIEITTTIQEQNLDKIYISLTTDDGKAEIKPVEDWKKATLVKDESSNEYTVTFKVEATKDVVENRYLYQVAAVDYAGNWTKNNAIEFVVDGKRPDVKENCIEKTEGDDINRHNDNDVYYSNKKVRITTVVTERFINSDGIQLNLKKDDIEYSYSLSQWLGKNDIKNNLGIQCRYDDSDPENKERTEKTITFEIPATEGVTEGVYSYQVTATDYSKNSTSNAAVDFCIDVTNPEVDVTYKSAQNGTLAVDGKGITYLNGQNDSFTGTITVKEKNMMPVDKNVVDCVYDDVNAYRYTGDFGETAQKDCKDALNELANDIKDKNRWTNNDSEHTYKFTCTKEANYNFPDFTVTDLAGNPAKEAKGEANITLDWTVPTGDIQVTNLISGGENGGKEWINTFLNALTFGLYGKDYVDATITSTDIRKDAEDTIVGSGSGIAEKSYYLATDLMSEDALNKLSSTQWTSYNGRITMAASRSYIVYEKVVDKAGNLAYYSSDRVIVDKQNPQPEVTITPTTPGWGKGVYSASDNPGFDVYVVDPAGSDGSCAGLAEIKCTITDRTTGNSKPVPLASFSATSAPEATYRTHVSIDPAEFYSNEVQVTVEAKDHSTNPATVESQVIKIDNKAPIVTFSFDKSDVHNGKYYNNDKTLTITVDERNFDESYKPQVTSTAGGGYSISGWSHNGEIHTATVTFSGDSDYTVTYDCYDLAGNKSNTEKLEEFTVDKTKPAIQVSYDNNNALNNDYYKDARTATITITEHNFNPGEVTVTTTAQLDGAPVAAPGVSGWSGSGDTHVATVSYSADADYTFTISATDLASNVSEPYVTDNFTVDQTKPTVEITNIEDHSANNGEVAPVVTLNDINFDSSKTVVHLTGANKGEVDTTGMYTSVATAKGQTLTFHNFAENMDDIYTLTAETTDKAGNVYSTSKMFSVNRDGSTYMYDSYTDELIKNGYTNDPKNLVVSEINVDTLTFQELTVTENGTLKTLEQDKDYEVQESGSEVSWKEYKYTINASNFEEEGDYNVSIYSEDRATNVTTNTSKSKDILFAVDKTSPVIALSNIEDGGRYKVESQKFTANVDDNMALDKVEYYVDGKLQQTFDASEVAAQSGSLELSVDSSSKFQKVSVKAYDKANNEATSADADVLVSASSWVQFYNNKPAFYGTIGGGVAVLAAAVAAGVHFSGAGAAAGTAGAASAGGLFFLAGKKKKDEEETK